jgi:putative ABC transport system permease protein
MRSLLFEVSPADPAILAGVSALLCWWRWQRALFLARKAASVDPMQALQAE